MTLRKDFFHTSYISFQIIFFLHLCHVFFINFLRLVFLLFTFQMSFGSVHIGQQIMRRYEKEKINCCFMEIIPMAYIVIEDIPDILIGQL